MFVFVGLTALGTAHLGAGREDEALPILERANRIGEASAPTVAYRAAARFALGRALWEVEAEQSARWLSRKPPGRTTSSRSRPPARSGSSRSSTPGWMRVGQRSRSQIPCAANPLGAAAPGVDALPGHRTDVNDEAAGEDHGEAEPGRRRDDVVKHEASGADAHDGEEANVSSEQLRKVEVELVRR